MTKARREKEEKIEVANFDVDADVDDSMIGNKLTLLPLELAAAPLASRCSRATDWTSSEKRARGAEEKASSFSFSLRSSCRKKEKKWFAAPLSIEGASRKHSIWPAKKASPSLYYARVDGALAPPPGGDATFSTVSAPASSDESAERRNCPAAAATARS